VNESCSNNTKRFHNFNWKNEEFKANYQTNLEILASELAKILFDNGNLNERNEKAVADIILEMIPIILIKAARNSESTTRKKLDNFKKISRECKQNVEIGKQIEETRELYNNLKKTNSEEQKNIKDKWIKSKKQLKMLIRKERFEKSKRDSNFIDKHYSENKNAFWKEITKRKKRLKTNSTTTKTNLNLAKFETFYTNLFSHVDRPNNQEQQTIEHDVNMLLKTNEHVNYEILFTKEDIINAISKLKSNKASGIDNISNEFYIHGKSESFVSIILWFFNTCATTGHIPEYFNVSKISPIPKKGKAEQPSDYRPISVSRSIATIFEHLMLNKINCFENIHQNQFGYKKKISSKNAYYVVNETINMYVQGDSRIHVVSLDASKAFDKMWRSGLFFKLKDKIDPAIWRLLYNYYKKSKARIFFDNKLGDPITISEGVKQGGILSPFLFNFYTNDLLESITKRNIGAQIGKLNVAIIAYCDDIILLASQTVDMQRLISICEEYAKQWKIEFNPKKSVSVTFNSKGETEEQIFKMSDESIPSVNGFIYLGLPIGNNGFVDEYIEEQFKKVQRSIFSLYSMGFKPKMVSPQTMGFVYKQYCQPTFRYCLENIKIPGKKLDELDVRQNTLIKNAIGLNKFVRTTPLLQCLKVESMRQLYKKRKVLFIKSIKQSQVCAYIYEHMRKKYSRQMVFKKNNKSYINQIIQIEKELKIDIEEYDLNVIRSLIELSAKNTDKETLKSVSQIIFYIKLYIKTKKDYFFLYKKLSDVLSYCTN
jgi:hypothetical protein